MFEWRSFSKPIACTDKYKNIDEKNLHTPLTLTYLLLLEKVIGIQLSTL